MENDAKRAALAAVTRPTSFPDHCWEKTGRLSRDCVQSGLITAISMTDLTE